MRQKNNILRIGIDLLGSDLPPAQLLGPLVALHQELKEKVLFTFFIPPALAKEIPTEIRTVICTEVITMEDEPLSALRKKKHSSIIQGVTQLQNHEIDAFISAGNTGALFASSQILIPLLPGIERSALLALLPTKKKVVAVIDVGANLQCKSQHLIQFALMGIAYQKSRGVEKPVVGLLNIGTEPKKGTPELQETYKHLHALSEKGSFHFFGNIEGRDLFQGDIDLLVTDGFSGNVLLKTAEGLAFSILELLTENKAGLPPSHLQASLAALRYRLHYEEHPGAILCGIDGIIIKCHGTGAASSFVSSAKAAMHLIEHNFLGKIKQQLSHSVS
ncbi:MAG: phosphate acyltransferase PlsX [Chlamydiales bacterium]